MKLPTILILLGTSFSLAGVPQNPPTAIPKQSVTFEYEDQCGSPLVESMLWQSLNGKVTKILAGNSLEITLNHKRTQISLAAVDVVRDPNSARAQLTAMVLHQTISVLVNFTDSGRKQQTGIVFFKTTDVNRTLIESGFAAYRKAPSYSMSDYTACVYRILERKARDAKKGIWRNPSP